MFPNSTNISDDFIWPNAFMYTSRFKTINSHTQGEEEALRLSIRSEYCFTPVNHFSWPMVGHWSSRLWKLERETPRPKLHLSQPGAWHILGIHVFAWQSKGDGRTRRTETNCENVILRAGVTVERWKTSRLVSRMWKRLTAIGGWQN